MPRSNHLKHLVTAALTTAGLLILAGCGGQESERTATPREVRVATVQAEARAVPRVVTATGSVAASKSIMVSTRMMGWIRTIHVREGQAVAKGDLLVSIDDTDLQAKKRQAEAGLAEARAVLANAERMAERFENLFEDKSVSQKQLDDVMTGRDRARAGVAMAEAGLAEVEVHLSYLAIRAPAAGIVARKMIEEGDMANPGMPLINLETAGAMKVVAHLAEKDVASVKPGDTLTVDVTSLDGAVYTATVDRMTPAANPGSRTYDIEAVLENPDGNLRSGMFARVRVPVGQRQAVLVPTEALVRRGQLTGLWTVDDSGHLHLRWVRTGHPQGAMTEILAGLDGGETLAVPAGQQLVEGDKVVR